MVNVDLNLIAQFVQKEPAQDIMIAVIQVIIDGVLLCARHIIMEFMMHKHARQVEPSPLHQLQPVKLL